jgi:hypothetical protein
MAYVFNSIDQSLNGDPTSQSNIFNAGPSASQDSATLNGANAGVKTTTEADLNGTIGSGSTSAASKPGFTPQAFNQSANAAVAKNTQEFKALPSQFQSQVGKINENLQNEANSYVKTAADKATADYTLDDATLSKAAAEDKDAGSRVSGVLRSTAPTVDAYQSSVDPTIKNLSSLNSQAGLSNLMSRGGAADYSSGMAGLDAMLMGQNKGFIAARQDLNNTQNALRDKVGDTAPITKQAQDAATAKFNQGTGYAKDYLTQRENDIQAAAAKRMADYNAQLKALSGNRSGYVDEQRDAALQELMRSAGRGALADDLSTANVAFGVKNPNYADAYYRPGAAINDPTKFYDADAASRFNNIEALLGGSRNIAAYSGDLGPQQSFDKASYQKALQAKAAEYAADRQRRESQAAQAALVKQSQDIAAANNQAGALAPVGTLAINPNATAGFDPTPTGFIFTQPPDEYAPDPRRYTTGPVGQFAF